MLPLKPPSTPLSLSGPTCSGGCHSVDGEVAPERLEILTKATRWLKGFAALWGIGLLLAGAPRPAIGCVAYILLATANRAAFVAGLLRPTRHVQFHIALLIFFPLLVQVLLGGFTASGGLVLWSAIGPIASIALLGSAGSWRCFTAFAVANLTALLLDGAFPSSFGGQAPAAMATANLFGVASVFFLVFKRYDQSLMSALRASEAASESKSRFLRNMSHELRTPLTAIIGYSEMLRESAHDDHRDDEEEDLTAIEQSGRYLLQLVNQVLDVSKVESGKMELHLERTDLRRVIERVISTATPLLQINGNRFEVQLDGCLDADGNAIPTFADVDPLRLEQVLLNLLSNAAKFTDCGVVTLAGSCDTDAVHFRIEDTGAGMTEAQLAAAFEPFEQFDPDPNKRASGTGLGLTISRHLVELMGGSMTATSEPGRGTRFDITLAASTGYVDTVVPLREVAAA